MLLVDVLNAIIDDVIADARYGGDGRALRAAEAAGEACRGKEPGELLDIIAAAAIGRVRVQETGGDAAYQIAYESAVEEIAAVMSCALMHLGLPPINGTDHRSRMRYASIVGVAQRGDATN